MIRGGARATARAIRDTHKRERSTDTNKTNKPTKEQEHNQGGKERQRAQRRSPAHETDVVGDRAAATRAKRKRRWGGDRKRRGGEGKEKRGKEGEIERGGRRGKGE